MTTMRGMTDEFVPGEEFYCGYRVSKLMNSAKNDSPKCIKPGWRCIGLISTPYPAFSPARRGRMVVRCCKNQTLVKGRAGLLFCEAR
jgi:hypothetical protein